MRMPLVIVFTCATELFIASPSSAASFWEKPLGDVGDVVNEGIEKLRGATQKLYTEIGNGLDALSKEAGKLLHKVIAEIGNGAEDLEYLVREGQCRGDICEAISAVVTFSEATMKGYALTVENFRTRIGEGKFIDALWHLQVDPSNMLQDHAAEAALKSSIIRAVGQAAATAYGGPGGTAGYAAWLTYKATDGDLGLSLRAGVIAGGTSIIMGNVTTMPEDSNVTQHLMLDMIAKRAVISGAVAGAAVAMSGGTQMDVEQAAAAGMSMSFIRDGYIKLTHHNLDDEVLKHSKGPAPCLEAPEPSGLSCAENNHLYGDEKFPGRTDYTRLQARTPHVGAVAQSEPSSIFSLKENGRIMVGFSKIPGMNAMGWPHDAFVQGISNSGAGSIITELVNIPTIPAFIVMTYSGAGFEIQELIRNEVVERAKLPPPAVSAITRTSDLEALAELGHGTNPSEALDQNTPMDAHDTSFELPLHPGGNMPAVELREMMCTKDADVRITLLEVTLDPRNVERPRDWVCSVDRLGGEIPVNLWHAHYQKWSCVDKFNEILLRNLRQGRECKFNVAIRYGHDKGLALGAVPTPADASAVQAIDSPAN